MGYMLKQVGQTTHFHAHPKSSGSRLLHDVGHLHSEVPCSFGPLKPRHNLDPKVPDGTRCLNAQLKAVKVKRNRRLATRSLEASNARFDSLFIETLTP